MWTPWNRMGKKNRDHRSAEMSAHRCGLLTMWLADPRVPIHFDAGTTGYYIDCGAAPRLRLKFCPFCGDPINARAEAPSAGMSDTCQTRARHALCVKPPACPP